MHVTTRSRITVVLAALTLVATATQAAASDDPPPSTAGPGGGDIRSEVVIGEAPQATARSLAAADAPSRETITFSEVPLYSSVTNQYVQRGILFGGDNPFTTMDGSNDTSPVISGTPQFQGAVEGRFVNPDGSVRTVDYLSLDVGYINTPHSTVVNTYGRTGELLLSVDLAAGGIVHTEINQVGMARFRVEAISDEPAGFAVDNVSFPTPGPVDGTADTYVALGDSYQSGQAAGDYEVGTDEGSGNGCRRSANAYPSELKALGTVDLELDFRACSNATIRSLINGMNGEESQLTALNSHTRLVTIGIVGNDLDFGPTVQSCITSGGASLWHPWDLYRSCEGNLGDDVDAKISSLRNGDIQDALYSLYRDIRARAPYARVIIVNYPKFFPEDGAPDGALFACQGIRVSDQLWINSQIVTADNIITRTARKAGFEYVDMATVLDGQEECTDVPAITGIRLDDLVSSFHPNSLGHLYMALRISDYLGLGQVHPSFTIHQGQTVTGTYTIHGSAFTLNTSWPGSDVVTTLISPSGVRYARDDPAGAEHDNGATWEYLSIPDPEPGQWSVEYYGADVAPDGEPVTVTTLDETPENQAPTATFTTAVNGSSVTFDATGSTDSDGQVTDYLWDFGDGTTATGPTATHTFAPGSYEVALVTTDDDGARGFGTSTGAIAIGTDPATATVYSATSLTLTNSTAIDGPGASVLVDGDFACNSDAHVAGNVTVTGTAYLTNSCRIDGTLWVKGTVRADSTAKVGGEVRAGGQVTLQSTVSVGGYLATAAGVTVTDGKSVQALQAAGAIGGEVYTDATTLPLPTTIAHWDTAGAPALGATQTTWAGWLKAIAQGAGAPSWSAALQPNPGCTLASWSAGTSSVAVTADTVVDATGPSCAVISLQGLTIDLKADLTLKVNSLASTNGLRVTASDGQAHRLTVVSAGTASRVQLVGPSVADSNVTVNLTSAGTVQIDGSTDLTGSIHAARLVTSGAVKVHSVTTS